METKSYFQSLPQATASESFSGQQHEDGRTEADPASTRGFFLQFLFGSYLILFKSFDNLYFYQVDHWRNLAQEKEKMLKENEKCFHPPPPASFSPLQVNDGIEIVVYTSLSGYQPEQGGGKPLHQKTAGGE